MTSLWCDAAPARPAGGVDPAMDQDNKGAGAAGGRSKCRRENGGLAARARGARAAQRAAQAAVRGGRPIGAADGLARPMLWGLSVVGNRRP